MNYLVALFFTLLLGGCASNLEFSNSNNNNNTTITQQQASAAAMTGARFTFYYSDYYTLTNPNPATACAGDANAFYDPLALTNSTVAGGYSNPTNTPLKLATSLTDSSTTIRPSFIKNVSVDVSDANSALSSNNAISCSFGSGVSAPPPSSCSTFDYGAIGGLPSLLGGTLLLVGGMTNINYAGINTFGSSTFTNYNMSHGLAVGCGPIASNSVISSSSSVGYNNCSNGMYALGINTLPASAAGSSLAPGLSVGGASTSISNWANLSSVTGYTGPAGVAGGTISYNGPLQSVLLFGGASPMAGMSTTGLGTTTYDTWIFNLKTQSWSLSQSSTVVDPNVQLSPDLNPSTSVLSYPTKGDGGRSLFGMVAAPGMGISQLGSTGLLYGTGASLIDTTDRIVIAGGYCTTSSQSCTDVHILNPTYAPEYIDALSPKLPIVTTTTQNRNSFPAQWIDNYYMRILSNSNSLSNYNPAFDSTHSTGYPVPSPTPSPSAPDTPVAFGMVALNNNNPANNIPTSGSLTGAGVGPGAFAGTGTGVPGAGYLLVAGGFHGNRSPAGSLNVPSGLCTTPLGCGNMELLTKWFCGTPGTFPCPSTWDQTAEWNASNFTSVANITPSSQFQPEGIENTPSQWVRIPDGSTSQTPWYGGGVMLKGLNSNQNEVVFFGGADCQNYLTASTVCPYWPNVKPNPGIYWRLGIDPAATLLGNVGASYPIAAPNSSYPTTVAMVVPTPVSTSSPTLPPINAGMAAARGTDPSGYPIIVAWGGMAQPGLPDNSGYIYYLYTNAGSPTWGAYQLPSGSSPPGLANASLVFSHVTGKFYLYGGYSPSGGSSSAIWQLSIGSTAPSASCGNSASAACTFTWTSLTSSNGLTCYPSTCPPARRSHRMVEVNYNYFNAPNEPDCHNSAQPCSFGLFMEGGTPDGVSILSDRWMFDPTANGGAGHWQLMGDMPPRTLASSANVDYTVPSTGNAVHRVILFGGETGMQNPYQATGPGAAGLSQGTGFFVPPTLGDTWIYDYTSNSWNRAKLYGERFSPSSIPELPILSETDARAASLSSDTTTNLLSPPPTAGGIMVTRTLSKAHHLATDATTALAIPEVYFFGGRTKDGMFAPISTTYKFCAGSTGEKPWPNTLSQVGVPLPNDASCDAFDPILNPQSPSPIQDYVGRWLMKTPVENYTAVSNNIASSVGSFMGAGTYDPLHDLVVMYGGLTPTDLVATGGVAGVGGDSVTNGTALNGVGGSLDSTGTIYEYTPPSAVGDGVAAHLNGTWTAVPTCLEEPGSYYPSGRYGHTLAYDSLNQNLMMVGGYNASGNLLTRSGTNLPEVWTAVRIDNSMPGGIPARNIPAITAKIPCYYWTPVTLFGNNANTEPTTGLAHASSVFIPASGYNSGFYSTNDTACVGAGPIASADPSISRLLAGGAYIDIDRTQLGTTENLILNLTFMPLGPTNIGPNQSYLTSDESAVFKIHLVRTGQSGDTIRTEAQPRYLTYASTTQYPEIVQNVAFISPPTGQIRQEQVLIPLSADPTIDRIRIERYSGNAILIEASVFRMSHN